MTDHIEPVRYAVIGCGGHAMDNHILPLVGNKLFRLAMLCDVSGERCEQLRQQFPNVLVTQTPMEVLLDPEVEAVVICTPDDSHEQYLAMAVADGKHVLVEKPAVHLVDLLPRLSVALTTAKANNLVVTSCHPWRYHPGLAGLHAVLHGARPDYSINDFTPIVQSFGQPLEFSFNFSYHAPSTEWKANRSLLVDHFNHEFDMLHYLFGDTAATFYRLTDGFDRYHVVGVRDDGLHCSFHGTRRLQSHRFCNYLSIRFERGHLEFNGNTGQLELCDHEWDHEQGNDLMSLPGINYAAQATAIMANFARSIRGNEQNYLTANDIYANTAACLHLAESDGTWRYEPNQYHL